MPSQASTTHHDMTLGALSCRRNEKDMMVVQHTSCSPLFAQGWPLLQLRVVSPPALCFSRSLGNPCAKPGVALHNCYSPCAKLPSQRIHDLNLPPSFNPTICLALPQDTVIPQASTDRGPSRQNREGSQPGYGTRGTIASTAVWRESQGHPTSRLRHSAYNAEKTKSCTKGLVIHSTWRKMRP